MKNATPGGRRMRLFGTLLTAAIPVMVVVVGGTGVTQADTIFQLGNNPQPDEENVLLNSGATGFTVFGVGNQTGLDISFSSTELITSPSSGNARIEATDGALNNITISVPGGVFSDL